MLIFGLSPSGQGWSLLAHLATEHPGAPGEAVGTCLRASQIDCTPSPSVKHNHPWTTSAASRPPESVHKPATHKHAASHTHDHTEQRRHEPEDRHEHSGRTSEHGLEATSDQTEPAGHAQAPVAAHQPHEHDGVVHTHTPSPVDLPDAIMTRALDKQCAFARPAVPLRPPARDMTFARLATAPRPIVSPVETPPPRLPS